MSEENLAAAFNENNAPFARMMGVKVTLATKTRLEAELLVTPDHCTIPATLHGGAIMAFADNLGGCGAFLNMPSGMMTTTVEDSGKIFSGRSQSARKHSYRYRAGSHRSLASGLENRNKPRGWKTRGDRNADPNDQAGARMTTLDRARRYARAFLAKTNDPVTALYAGEAAYLAGAGRRCDLVGRRRPRPPNAEAR
ncbi:MAG: PaaI family thioesterase [Parvularculaceae bacterium]